MNPVLGGRLSRLSRRVFGYSPHRAMVVLGALLMAIAVAGGLLGVHNSAQAETATSTITGRYLVLQTPLRQMRAAAADFQNVVGQSFGGTVLNPRLLARAVGDDTATDQNYLDLAHLLASGNDGDLAPALAAQVADYDAARTTLAAFLTGGARTAQNDALAVREQAVYGTLDAALGQLQATITDRLIVSATQAHAAARTARSELQWSLGLGLPVGVVLTWLFARKARRAERKAAARDVVQARINERSEFESRLQRALEMANNEEAAFDVVAQVLGEAAPANATQLLLADSSRAHFHQALATAAVSGHTGCGVVSPTDCPAARRGQTMVFANSTAVDTCPHLRGRGCSALCVPVSIGGNSAGVIHMTSSEENPPSEATRRDIEVVARRASERFAMLRAFEMSQTQANTDSLTGLFTRRSLEERIRELDSTATPYAVAYGDLDHFKQLNDVFGHSTGDRALRLFSQTLRDSLRPSDLACRYGGEEFIVVLPECRANETLIALERVRQRLTDRLNASGLPNFTVSFGVALSDQGPDFDAVVALADEALLQAKTAGRDQIIVADAHRPEAQSIPDTATGPTGPHRPTVVL